ncbi:hypothetical protein ES708_26513 [subsurface metagenome]
MVPECVIHPFKPIKVKIQQGKYLITARRRGNCLVKPVPEKHSIRQTGQTIIKGEQANLFLRPFQPGHVLNNSQQYFRHSILIGEYFPLVQNVFLSAVGKEDTVIQVDRFFCLHRLVNFFLHRIALLANNLCQKIIIRHLLSAVPV